METTWVSDLARCAINVKPTIFSWALDSSLLGQGIRLLKLDWIFYFATLNFALVSFEIVSSGTVNTGVSCKSDLHRKRFVV